MVSAGTTAAASSSLQSSNRGLLSRRKWLDIRRAARIAREEGVRLVVHGIVVDAEEPREQPRLQPRDWSLLRRSTETVASVQQRSDSAPNPPQTVRKREERSRDRLVAFNSKRRRQLIASSPRIQTLLRQFRWNRMQSVWIQWKQQQQQQQLEEAAEEAQAAAAREVAVQVGHARRPRLCSMGHAMQKTHDKPANYARLFCDHCRKRCLELDAFFYHCAECHYDLCWECCTVHSSP